VPYSSSSVICERSDRQSLAAGVGLADASLGNPPQSLPDVGRADARSAEIDRRAGVTRSFQVSLYKVEPSEAVLARNLLAKDDWRAALADEMVEGGP
jgi:hypothetical protein